MAETGSSVTGVRFPGRGRGARRERQVVALLVALVMAAAALVLLKAVPAAAQPPSGFNLASWNMEGSGTTSGATSDGTSSGSRSGRAYVDKFTAGVMPLVNRRRPDGTRFFDAIALQEVGALPASARFTQVGAAYPLQPLAVPAVMPAPAPGAPPLTYDVEEWSWNLGTASRPDLVWVYYLRSGGTRLNLAIVTIRRVAAIGGPASDVFVVAPQPLASGVLEAANRPSLAIRLSAGTIFGSVHTRPGAGNDGLNIVAAYNTTTPGLMLPAVPGAPAAAPVVPHFILAGDLNEVPGDLPAAGTAPPGTPTLPAGVTVLSSGQVTRARHFEASRELDYFLTNDPFLAGLLYLAARLNSSGFSDHYPVGVGINMTAGAEEAAGPVHFRWAPGQCLISVGSVGRFADGDEVRVGDCTGRPEQDFSFEPDGTVRASIPSAEGFHVQCLDNYGVHHTDGNRVTLWACNGGANQQWVPRANGTLFNPDSGRCLDGHLDGQSVVIDGCGGAVPWDVPTPGPTGHITSHDDAGQCLAMPSGASVVMQPCAADARQNFTFQADGTIRDGNSQCLNIGGDRVVALSACHGGPNQRWDPTSDGPLFNVASTTCLDGRPGATTVTAKYCDGVTHWTFPFPRGDIRPLKDLAYCIHPVYGTQGPVEPKRDRTAKCSGDDAIWTLGPKGTIRENLNDSLSQNNDHYKCLTGHDGNNADTNRVNSEDCYHDSSQEWRPQPNGTLLNPATGKCLAYGNDPGWAEAWLRLETCADVIEQKWSLPVSFGSLHPTDRPGLCLDHGTGNTDLLNRCVSGGSSNQTFTKDMDGAFRDSHGCLTIDDTPRPLGDYTAHTANCTAANPRQEFDSLGDGEIYSVAIDACLAYSHRTPWGANLGSYGCTYVRTENGPYQGWDFSASYF